MNEKQFSVGEHFIPGTSRITEIESFHRYIAAAELCRDCRVLDAASGDGYGSAVLSQKSRSVTGIDCKKDAIQLAKQKYPLQNLQFVTGNICEMPFPDASFDRVVSFETVEHISDPGRFLSEIRRVLTPKGLLILSSPNKKAFDRRNRCENGKNPYHVREMEPPELEALLRPFFPHIAFYQQDAFYNSVISRDEESCYYVKNQQGEIQTHAGLETAQYTFLCASSVELPKRNGSVFIDAYFDSDYGYCFDDEAVVNQFGLRGELERSRQCVAEQKKQLEMMQQTVENSKTEFRMALRKIADGEEQRKKLQSDLISARNQISSCESQRNILQDELIRTKNKIVETEAEKEKLQSELSETYKKIMSDESKRKKLAENLNMAQNKISDEENQKKILQDKLNNALKLILDGETQKKNLQKEIDQLRLALRDEHAKSEYLFYEYNELKKSWALRIFGRFSIRKRLRNLLLNMGQYLHRFLKKIFLMLPYHYRFKLFCKDFFYGHFGWLVQNVQGYKDWKIKLQIQNDTLLKGDTGLVVPSDLPLTSIVIPVYNNLELTKKCLFSIYGICSKSPFEVIIADDCSTEDVASLKKDFPLIKIIRNEKNSGFLLTANRSGFAANGEYLIFLNNDTEVLPGWLDELTTALYNHPEAGMIGSQLIHNSTQRLQESGNLVCKNGEMLPLGRGEMPDRPEFNFFREVDFCSAASIILRKKVFEEMQGFDTIYAPAYFEDPDLGLRMKKAGYKNYVMPLSRLLHHEMASYGSVLDTRSQRNRKIFNDRWDAFLQQNALYDTPAAMQRSRKYLHLRLLYLDAEVPMADRGSGGMDAIFFMEYFIKRGYDVVFYGDYTPGYIPKYTPILLRMGVECIYQPYRKIWEYLASAGWMFRTVFVSRIYQARSFDRLLKKYCPQAVYVFNTVDVHFVRETLEAKLRGSEAMLRKAMQTKKYELQVAEAADATIVISCDEQRMLEQDYHLKNVWHIPQARKIFGLAPNQNRHGAVFIGSAHPPNMDGLRYFHDEILPLLPKDFQLTVIGEALKKVMAQIEEYKDLLSCPQFHFVGFVQDLGSELNQALLTVAPLRYGAGTKGKVASSMAYGVPCVSSNFGTEGTGMINRKNILIAATPQEFADAIKELSENKKLWKKISDGGLEFLRQNYSVSGVEEKMDALMEHISVHQAESRWSTTPVIPKEEETPDD